MAATESKDNKIMNILNNFQPVGMYKNQDKRSATVLQSANTREPIQALVSRSRDASRSRQSDRSLSNGPVNGKLNERVQQLVAKSYTSEYLPEQPYIAPKKEANPALTVQQNSYE